jgi:type IV secretory pathway TrbD component
VIREPTGLLAFAFLSAEVMKLTSPPMELQLFTLFGLPIWTMSAVAVLRSAARSDSSSSAIVMLRGGVNRIIPTCLA